MYIYIHIVYYIYSYVYLYLYLIKSKSISIFIYLFICLYIYIFIIPALKSQLYANDQTWMTWYRLCAFNSGPGKRPAASVDSPVAASRTKRGI